MKMKRILSFVLCAVMIAAMSAVGASAVSFTEDLPDTLGELVAERSPALEDVAEYYGFVNDLKEGGGHFCPKDDCWVRYEVNLEKAGTYTFAVLYAAPANADIRAVNYAIDSLENNQVYVELEFTDPGSSYEPKWYFLVTEELSAGTHSFYILTPTGFDNATVKSFNFHGLSVYLTKEAVVETPLEEIPAEEVEVPVEEPAADTPAVEVEIPAEDTTAPVVPKTADNTAALVIAFAAFAFVASAFGKKRCH